MMEKEQGKWIDYFSPALLILFLCSPILAWGYRIEGRVNIGDEWQPQVYMAAVEQLTDYYRASADLIINVGTVRLDGSFVLEGNNLPDEARFYRLYLMKEQNTEYDACLYVGGDDHNFIHVVLSNNSQLEIIADDTTISPFGNYDIKGDQDNQLMRELARIIYPKFSFYKIKFPTELRLSEERLHYDLKNFVDTTQSTLAALAAMNNTNWDEFFETDKIFYTSFGERLQTEITTNNYTEYYFRKLRYHSFEDVVRTPVWMSILLVSLSVLLLLATLYIIHLQKNLTIAQSTASTNETNVLEIDRLTLKEREILQLIQEGKSNKEIASSLYVEVSTVKSHINKLYSKLQVHNRREAMQKARELEV